MVRQRSAKPLSIGSIPIAASIYPSFLALNTTDLLRRTARVRSKTGLSGWSRLSGVRRNLHVGAAPLACRVPSKWSLDRRPRVARSLKEIHRDTYDCSLHRRIIRFAARIAQWEVREHEARNAALLDDIPRRADYYGRNAVRLEVPSDQTHGLMANRSQRHEKRNIDTVSTTQVEDCWSIPIDGPALAEVSRRAVKAWRKTANPTGSGELCNALDR